MVVICNHIIVRYIDHRRHGMHPCDRGGVRRGCDVIFSFFFSYRTAHGIHVIHRPRPRLRFSYRVTDIDARVFSLLSRSRATASATTAPPALYTRRIALTCIDTFPVKLSRVKDTAPRGQHVYVYIIHTFYTYNMYMCKGTTHETQNNRATVKYSCAYVRQRFQKHILLYAYCVYRI